MTTGVQVQETETATEVVRRENNSRILENRIADKDRDLGRLLTQHSSQLRWQKRDVIADGEYQQTVYDPVGADYSVEFHNAMDAACWPMEARETHAALVRLKTLCIPRKEDAVDLPAQLLAYQEMLDDYPADVARYVLQSQPAHSKWFPTWHELQLRLEYSGRQRMVMKRVVLRQQKPTTNGGTQ